MRSKAKLSRSIRNNPIIIEDGAEESLIRINSQAVIESLKHSPCKSSFEAHKLGKKVDCGHPVQDRKPSEAYCEEETPVLPLGEMLTYSAEPKFLK